MKNYNEIITTTEHNHFGGSLFDAVDEVKNYLTAVKNAGYKNVAVTDHGSFSSMQTCYDLSKKMNLDLKIIYGVEAYVEVPPFSIDEKVAHLILIAVDEEGKHIIDKLNSSGVIRKGVPVITWDKLTNMDLKGHVIATSACISGAPALQLQANDILDKMINRLSAKQDKKDENDINCYLSPNHPEYLEIKKHYDIICSEIVNLTQIRDSEEWKTKRKDINAKKRVAKAQGNQEEYEKCDEELKRCEEMLLKIKDQLTVKKNERTIVGQKLKYVQEKVNGWMEIEEEKHTLKKKKVSEYDLIKNAESKMLEYANIFGKDNYYVELQYHGMDEEKKVYPVLAKIAKNIGLKLIAANDAHMADNTKRSINMRKVAKFLRFRTISESDADNEMYIKTPNELAEALLKILPEDIVDEAMMSLNEIGEKCIYEPRKVPHYPKFNKSINSDEALRKEAYAGIKERYLNEEGWDEEHKERLEYELGIIIQMGFADYFLIVQDFLEYGRICGKVPYERLKDVPLTIEGAKKFVEENGYEIGIGVGIGRGSAAGSLVAYLLKITEVDPLKYGLVFERFLNPERISMPDIDSDFANGVREKTIEFVINKYGTDAVVGIITESREGVKGAIRDAASYYGQKIKNDKMAFSSLGDSMRKLVPVMPGITFNSKVSNENTVYESLVEAYSENPDALAILDIAKDLEGMLFSYSQHAAGVIIYDEEDITDYIPTRVSKTGERITECDMIQAEAIKLLKMDFLGLKNLNILTETARLVKENTGKTIDIVNLPVEGEEADRVYREIYAKGRTKNVFQFESPGMRKYLKQLLEV